MEVCKPQNARGMSQVLSPATGHTATLAGLLMDRIKSSGVLGLAADPTTGSILLAGQLHRLSLVHRFTASARQAALAPPLPCSTCKGNSQRRQ